MLNIKQNKALTHPYFTKIKILAVFVPKWPNQKKQTILRGLFLQ